ncbi:MAG TPA: glycosyltransferase family 4 protein [Blastocatellia bacterium]|nr:glycosyltransferase family 4 protein [Blastocatellia bacterium]
MSKKGRPDLLIITSSFPRGPGDETCGYIRDFARGLSARFNVTVLAPPDAGASEWPEDDFALTRSASIPPAGLSAFESSRDLNDLPRRGLPVKLASCLSLLLFVSKALRLARKADVICSHWLAPSGLTGALASMLLGKPHVAVEHSGALHFLRRARGGPSVARFIIRHSRRVITVSSDLRDRLIGLCPEAEAKVEVIPMGAGFRGDPSKPPREAAPGRGGESPSKTALFIGRLVEIKGVELLLQALDGMSDVRLIIAGEGERRQALEKLASGMPITVKFLGQVDATERGRLLELSDFMVIPSLVFADGRSEGTPVVCLESLATGLPVVASRAGGLAEVITDGYNGLLFDPGNSGALARAMRRLIDDPKLRERLSANARATAKEYSWEAIGDRYASAILRAMGEND